jgi:hypothetical protein
MKKNLLLGFLILFVLNTAAFAGLSDPKKGSEKPAINNPKENKLSDEEISRLSRRAEIDHLNNSSLSNKEKNDSKNNLRPSKQYYGEHHHHGYYYGGAGLVLLIILIVILLR